MVSIQERFHSTVDKYEAKDFSFFFKSLDGISEDQLKQHYTLYEGYIKKINEIQDYLKNADHKSANATYSEMRELQVEQSYALNGVILHELYFSNMVDRKTEPTDAFKMVIERDFGSWENYINDLKAVGMSMRGWAITAYNYRDGKVHNYGLDTHNMFVPLSVRPLLIMDVYEHAYMIDYGVKRASYIDSFLKNVHWPVVSERFESALKTIPEEICK